MLYNKKKLRIFFLVVLVLSVMKQIKVEVEGLSLLIETTACPPSAKLTLTIKWLVVPLAQYGTQIGLRSLDFKVSVEHIEGEEYKRLDVWNCIVQEKYWLTI